ncbi:Glutamine-rich protein 2 [Gigaspora margarita]|uniref:Glutamine-rich protein 2 n=1 Tax=Gigaspora margarita TaxID=4874 RepID=A0A8H4AZ29_GIGMA|nr:Glutamine-rich protein 2 [Gigaspora margarita]
MTPSELKILMDRAEIGKCFEIVLNVENFKNVLKIAYLNALNNYRQLYPNGAIGRKEKEKNLWKQKKSIKFLAFVKIKFDRVDNTDIPRATSTNVPISNVHIPNASISNVPIFNASISNVPIFNAPISNVPIFNAPISNVPISNVPISNVPVSNVPISNVPALVLADKDFNPKWLESVRKEFYEEFLKHRIFKLEKSLNQIIELEKENGHLQHENRLLKADLSLLGHKNDILQKKLWDD